MINTIYVCGYQTMEEELAGPTIAFTSEKKAREWCDKRNEADPDFYHPWVYEKITLKN